VLATSLPRCQAEARPDEAAAGGGLGAPAVWASEGLDYVQAVRTAVGSWTPCSPTRTMRATKTTKWGRLARRSHLVSRWILIREFEKISLNWSPVTESNP
jgi:hypothetical protein